MSDFSQLAGMFPDPTNTSGLSTVDPNTGTDQPTPEGNMKDLQSRMVAADQQQQPFQLPPGIKKMQIGPDGMTFHGVDPRLFESLMQSDQKLKEIMGSFHQESEKLKAQEARLATPGGAIGQALSTLAGNLATQKDMPGWVRGLGQTAKDLNPSRESIVNRRLGMEGEEAQIAEKRAGIQEKLLGQQQMGDEKTAALMQKQQEERGRIEKAAGIDARKGEFDSDSYVQELVTAGETPERARAAAERLEATSSAAKKNQETLQARKDKETEEKEKRFQQTQNDAMARVMAPINARMDKEDKKTAESEQKRQDMLARPVAKPITELRDTELALDDIEKLVKELPDMQGPIAGNIEKMDPYRKAEVQKIVTKLDLALPRTVKVTGGGARAYGPMEVGYFKNLSEGVQHTKEQNLAIIKDWRDFISQSRQGIYETASANGLDMSRYRKAYGKDASLLDVKDPADTAGAPSFDDFQKWKDSKK